MGRRMGDRVGVGAAVGPRGWRRGEGGGGEPQSPVIACNAVNGQPMRGGHDAHAHMSWAYFFVSKYDRVFRSRIVRGSKKKI